MNEFPFRYRNWVADEVEAFNNGVNLFIPHIGEENTITLCFTYEGKIHTKYFINDKLLIPDKEDFVEELTLKYEESVENNRESELEEKSRLGKKAVTNLENHLMTSEEFYFCSNAQLRKGYIYNYLSENSDISSALNQGEINRIIEECWKRVKYSEKFGNGGV